MEAYALGWKLGLKAVAIYRENSKRSQPLATSKGGNTKASVSSGDGMPGDVEPQIVEREVEKIVYRPVRKRLPDERPSITHKFSIAGHEGYLHIGLYPDTSMPGEIFVTMAKQGSTIAGLMDGYATATSIALQYGVPLEDLCNKFSHMRFEPSGFTNNRQIPIAKSIMDYIARYLSFKFLGKADAEEAPGNEDLASESDLLVIKSDDGRPAATPEVHIGSTVEEFLDATDRPKAAGASARAGAGANASFQNQEDAPPCPNCGSITVRAGSCYSCPNCGNTSGCG
jgi:ribonucleoside-diphosphate reductase alpha chain